MSSEKVYKTGYEKFVAEMKETLANDKDEILKQEKMSDEQKEMQRQMMVGLANLFAGYVKKECESNPDFNKAVLQEHKSVKRLIKSVLDKAKERQRNGMAYVPDDVVLDWVSDYFFLDDKAQIEAEEKKKVEAEARAKAKKEAEAKLEAEAEAMAKESLAKDEAYNSAEEKDKERLFKDAVKKAKSKIRSAQKRAEKAAAERKAAEEALADNEAYINAKGDAREKLIKAKIKEMKKAEKEAKAKKKAEDEAKAKERREELQKKYTETKPEAESKTEETKTEEAKTEEVKAEKVEKTKAEEVKTEPTLLEKAKAILDKCDAKKVVALYKRTSVEEMTERELDNLVSHKDQVLAKFAVA